MFFKKKPSNPFTDPSDLVERAGKYYKKNNSEPFNGKSQYSERVVEHNDFGGKIFDQEITTILTFAAGVPSLNEMFFDNGQLYKRYSYKDGALEGVYEEFNRSGYIILRGNYAKGEKDGAWEEYLISSLEVTFNSSKKKPLGLNDLRLTAATELDETIKYKAGVKQ